MRPAGVPILDLDYGRDLVMTAVIFGFAAFVWAGWAQERPPGHVGWRVVFAALGVVGLALAGFGIPTAVRNWETATALASGSPALLWYIIVFWIEVATIIAIAVIFARTKRTHLMAPAVLIIVGVHFVPLAFVFAQPIIMLAAVLITLAGVAAILLPREVAAASFWCGMLAAPILVALGVVALTAGSVALGSP